MSASIDSMLDAADRALYSRDLEAAEDLYRRALAQDPELADAHYGLGLIADARGNREEMVTRFLRTLELDAAWEPEVSVSLDRFQAIAEAAMAELPPRALELLENVAIVIDPAPSAEQVKQGIDPRLLGLFHGVDLGHGDGVTTQRLAPDTISLYKRNLEAACGSEAELAAEIRITLLHETAHFFGLDDHDLDEIGLG